MKVLLSTIILLNLVLFSGLSAFAKDDDKSKINSEYKRLISKFPLNKQGTGIEPGMPDYFTDDQPMTYGLILSAESRRALVDNTINSKVRILNAARWLITNSDADRDRKPGWGLPQAWDAFQDGSVNPENHPYTITTAIVMMGLLDALSLDEFFSPAEKKAILDVLKSVGLRWVNEVWVEDLKTGYGYFAYSPSPEDFFDLPNSSGMFLGSLSRLISEHRSIFNESEQKKIQEKIDKAAKEVISKGKYENGIPSWNYITVPNKLSIVKKNDLVHHSYVIYGIEMYRESGGIIEIPWTQEEAIKSFEVFWRDNRLFDFPQNTGQSIVNDTPARLWAIGMMMAVYGQLEDYDKAIDSLNYIKKNYGVFPDVTFWPSNYSDDKKFYPRLAAHVLFGMSTVLR